MLLGRIGRSHFFVGCNWAELCDPESKRRQSFVKSVGSKSLEGSCTWGILGLECLLLFMYFNLFSSGSIYRLEAGGEANSSVSSLITHLCVILCLHHSSLLFKLSFYFWYLMNMA